MPSLSPEAAGTRASFAFGRESAFRIISVAAGMSRPLSTFRVDDYPLTAPAVRPRTRNLRTRMENTSTGSITMVPPAAILPHSHPS